MTNRPKLHQTRIEELRKILQNYLIVQKSSWNLELVCFKAFDETKRIF